MTMTYYKVKAQSLYQSDQLLKCFIVPLKSVFHANLKRQRNIPRTLYKFSSIITFQPTSISRAYLQLVTCSYVNYSIKLQVTRINRFLIKLAPGAVHARRWQLPILNPGHGARLVQFHPRFG